jgi:predicted RNA-binding Zn-ribbon protein involved in translation (DUF1610 family)
LFDRRVNGKHGNSGVCHVLKTNRLINPLKRRIIMAFCSNCGTKMEDGAKFCPSCGTPAGGTAPVTVARSSKDGEVIKCPSCGAPVGAFDVNCPECGHELRNRQASRSVAEFFERYSETTLKDRAAIVKAFPVPNTREDILGFLTMGIGNAKPLTSDERLTYNDLNSFSDLLKNEGKGQEELRNREAEIAAWQAKVQQVLDMGKMLFKDPEALALFQKYEKQLSAQQKNSSANQQKKLLILVGIIFGVMTIGAILLISFSPSGEKETKRLNKLAQEIVIDIENENWASARVKAIGMGWEYEPTSSESRSEVEKWEQRRQELLNQIEAVSGNKTERKE